MDLIEAKRFEYCLNYFVKKINCVSKDYKVKRLPSYKILWQSDNNLFTCNTYLDVGETEYGQKNYELKSKTSSPLFGICEYIRSSINNYFKNSKKNPQDIVDIYSNDLLFFDFLISRLNNIEIKEEVRSKIDQTTIFNLKDFRSKNSRKLEFLKVNENFKLDPVSLIKNSNGTVELHENHPL